MARKSVAAPRTYSAPELKAQIEAERAGVPFLVCRDGDGNQRLITLGGDAHSLWVGRSPSSDVRLDWDPEVSTIHAQLERGAEEWTLFDEGLSRNGSYVNSQRVQGRRRLRDRDVLRLGQTVLTYRSPRGSGSETTMLSDDVLTAASLSEAQRRVLTALCRPFKDPPAFATPATNRQIAQELFISVDAVKVHLRALFVKFGIAGLPQNSKRLALVERALHSGVISERDL